MSFNLEWLLSRNVRIHPKERILKKISITDSGCWEYTGKKDRCGYGVFKIGGRNLGAHKVSYILHKGDFDQDNKEMMHLCHNRCCINPEHIKPGTHKENMSFIETRLRIRKSCRKDRLGKTLNTHNYGVMAEKEKQTILIGSSYIAEKLGFSSGSISRSCSRKPGREKYRGYLWSYI